jgi:murein L,D-transpeptidase YcbB/YkuD
VPANLIAYDMETEGKCSEGHVGEIHFPSVSELARTDDGETLPAVTKPVDPSQPYAGVPRLVRFLRLVGNLSADATLSTDRQTYSGPLVDAVKHFQRRHGLDADGCLGPSTIKQFIVPIHDRVPPSRSRPSLT